MAGGDLGPHLFWPTERSEGWSDSGNCFRVFKFLNFGSGKFPF
jgi:hypothetical protein